MFGLADLLEVPPRLVDGQNVAFFDKPAQKFCSPGYWVSVAALARERRLKIEDMHIRSDSLGFAKALGIEKALGLPDSYKYKRLGQGGSYSPLVVLENAEDVDRATSDICGCIRLIFPDAESKKFVRDICDVVGDLHDNVWSHGLSTGISQAYRFRKPYSQGAHSCFEFGLADCGYGFLRELRRAGLAAKLGIESDQAAIDWCIQEGHSSKMAVEDEWAQRLPPDHMGNPIGDAGRVLSSGNHHQGLGLHKLVQLVRGYGGQLWLGSGEALLHIDEQGLTTYSRAASPWSGVTLACRFDTENVIQRAAEEATDELDDLLGKLLAGVQP